MPPKKKISQELFDEAVKENIEEFDMAPEEAVQSAVEEFESQGVDLSGIIKSANANSDEHPVTLGLAAARDAAASLPEKLGDLQSALSELMVAFSEEDDDKRKISLGLAHSKGAVEALMECATAAKAHTECLTATMDVLAAVLATDELRDKWGEDAQGPRQLAELIKEHSGNVRALEAMCKVGVSAATKNEDNSCHLIDVGIVDALAGLLQADGADVAVAAAAARLIKAALTPDDLRPPTSRAFQNARLLAQKGAHHGMLAIARREDAGPEAAAACMAALRRIACNDEVCKEVAAAGGVQVAADNARSALAAGERRQLLFSCAVLRQLANSDDLKSEVADAGGFDIVASVARGSVGDSNVMEQNLGVLVNLCLRRPDHARKAWDAGCGDVVAAVLAEPACAKSGPVMRQACQAVRNLVVRQEELRAQMAAKGVEPLLRAAAERHKSCGDLASAALRDLGVEDYKVGSGGGFYSNMMFTDKDKPLDQVNEGDEDV